MYQFISGVWNKLFIGSLVISCLSCIAVIGLCLGLLTYQSLPLISAGTLSEVFMGSMWDPYSESYGIFPMIIGSFLLAIGSVVLALPISISISTFLVSYCPKFLIKPLKAFLALMLAIPSVVFGMWGISIFSPLFIKFNLPSLNLVLGILVLFLMLVPTMTTLIVFNFESALKDIDVRAQALGLSLSSKIWKILLPSQKPVVFAASILGLAKALGETMAVLMVSGNIPQLPDSVFSPVRALTANIALEMAYAMDDHRSSLYLSGLSLMLSVSILAILGFVFLRSKKSLGWQS